MPVPDAKTPRSTPLTPAQRHAILDAVTIGGRSQRAVGEDPAIAGTHDQVRGVVREAILADPSLVERFPKLIRRTPPDVCVLDVVDTDETAPEQTAAESLVAAGVPLAEVRFARATTYIRWRIHVGRNSDGTVSAVRVKHVETRVEWVPADTGASMPPVTQVPAQVLPAATSPALRARVRRFPARLAVALLVLLLAVGAALLRRLDAAAAAPSLGVGRIDGGGVPR